MDDEFDYGDGGSGYAGPYNDTNLNRGHEAVVRTDPGLPAPGPDEMDRRRRAAEGQPGGFPSRPFDPREVLAAQQSWTQVAQSLPFDEGARQELSRLQSGLAGVQRQTADGVLYPHEAEDLTGQLMQRIGPLVQRQQQSEQFAKQKQVEDAMHGAALAAMVQNENTRQQMSVLPHSVQMLPTEHGPVMLAPDGKGGVQQLDVPQPPDQPGGIEGAPPPGEADRPVDAGEQPGEADRPVGGQPATSQGPFKQTFYQGGYKEEYEGGRMVSTDRPQPAAESASPGGRHYEEAKKILGQPPQQFVRGAHGQTIPNPQYAAYHRAAVAMALDMWKTDRQHAAHAEHQRAEQAKADAADRKKQQDDHADKWGKSYQTHLDALQKEFNLVRTPPGKDAAGNDKPSSYIPPEDRPPEFKDRAGMEAEAKRRADDAHVSAYGEDRLPETRKKERAAQKAGTNVTPNQPQAPAANESPPGGPGAGPTGTNATVPPADVIKDADEKVKAAEAKIAERAKNSPADARVAAWDTAHKQVTENTKALPADATDEQKWLAQRPAMSAPQLAELYDQHRAERLYDANVGGARGSAIDADEERIRSTTRGNPAMGTPEEFKAGIVHRQGITPQQVERLRAANRAARARQKALDDAARKRGQP